jgi:hypothetical protein
MDPNGMSIAGEWLGRHGVLVLTDEHLVFIADGVVEWKMRRAEARARFVYGTDECTIALVHRRDRTELHGVDCAAAVAFANALATSAARS